KPLQHIVQRPPETVDAERRRVSGDRIVRRLVAGGDDDVMAGDGLRKLIHDAGENRDAVERGEDFAGEARRAHARLDEEDVVGAQLAVSASGTAWGRSVIIFARGTPCPASESTIASASTMVATTMRS